MRSVQMHFPALGLSFRIVTAAGLAAASILPGVAAQAPDAPPIPPYLFTSAPRYEPQAWLTGRDRFPVRRDPDPGFRREPAASGLRFPASADAAVSYDGTKALFAGKREAPATGRSGKPPSRAARPGKSLPAIPIAFVLSIFPMGAWRIRASPRRGPPSKSFPWPAASRNA